MQEWVRAVLANTLLQIGSVSSKTQNIGEAAPLRPQLGMRVLRIIHRVYSSSAVSDKYTVSVLKTGTTLKCLIGVQSVHTLLTLEVNQGTLTFGNQSLRANALGMITGIVSSNKVRRLILFGKIHV